MNLLYIMLILLIRANFNKHGMETKNLGGATNTLKTVTNNDKNQNKQTIHIK